MRICSIFGITNLQDKNTERSVAYCFFKNLKKQYAIFLRWKI